MAIVAHARPFVIGVDTHARNHAISILACPTGEIVDEAQFPATAAGLSRAVSWGGRRTGGDAGVLWVIEGTGTYGARLARAASDAGYAVVEAPRMNARANRGIGKSDPLDARRIAAASPPQRSRSRTRSCANRALTTVSAPPSRCCWHLVIT